MTINSDAREAPDGSSAAYPRPGLPEQRRPWDRPFDSGAQSSDEAQPADEAAEDAADADAVDSPDAEFHSGSEFRDVPDAAGSDPAESAPADVRADSAADPGSVLVGHEPKHGPREEDGADSGFDVDAEASAPERAQAAGVDAGAPTAVGVAPVPAPLDGEGGGEGAGETAPEGELKPGEAPFEPVDALWNEQRTDEFRGRWREAQLSFVDDPRQAVEQIRSVVVDAVEMVTSALAQQRGALDDWQQSGTSDTEQLRMAIHRYRSFFDRLLNL